MRRSFLWLVALALAACGGGGAKPPEQFSAGDDKPFPSAYFYPSVVRVVGIPVAVEWKAR